MPGLAGKNAAKSLSCHFGSGLQGWDEGGDMGFFGSRISFARFRPTGSRPDVFSTDTLDALNKHKIGNGRAAIASADGIDSGWIAGDHILDRKFDLAKNIVSDTLQWALRIDAFKIPPDLLRAYAAEELEALSASNPSGNPSNRQRREAKDRAKERLEDEARDGRFVKRKAHGLLWDLPSGELLVSGAGAPALDRLFPLFDETFGTGLEPLSAGRHAFLLAETRNLTRAIDDATPSAFVQGRATDRMHWSPDQTSRDFLGNEFLAWLWFVVEERGDSLKLRDDSEAAVLPVRTLTLECPAGETGKETITSDAPTRLPEARRALQSGKLPRKMGFIVSRHDQQYEFTLSAETLAVSGLKLPAPEGDNERVRDEERIGYLRDFLETLDLMFDAFLAVRAADGWTAELDRMRNWLNRAERGARAQAAR